jgi:hypothetical protein
MITEDTIVSHLSAKLPAGTFSVYREQSTHGLLTRVEPANPKAAAMALRTNGSSTCNILFGRAFSLELELDDDHLLLKLVDAVRNGNLVEKIWTISGRMIYTKSAVRLPDRVATTRSGVPFFYPPFWKKTYRYEPY